MAEKTLDDLFYEHLKDVYFAERQIFKTLPKMAKGATEPALKEAFLHHRKETESQIQRLEQVFELIDKPARGKTCEAIKGILEEGSETLDDFEGSPALDAGLIADGQAVEHYEMARYGTLISWATQMGKRDVVTLLKENLKEEEAADLLLSKIASQSANKKAAA
jgi:ferritin-like metal-binding protein YciE